MSETNRKIEPALPLEGGRSDASESGEISSGQGDGEGAQLAPALSTSRISSRPRAVVAGRFTSGRQTRGVSPDDLHRRVRGKLPPVMIASAAFTGCVRRAKSAEGSGLKRPISAISTTKDADREKTQEKTLDVTPTAISASDAGGGTLTKSSSSEKATDVAEAVDSAAGSSSPSHPAVLPCSKSDKGTKGLGTKHSTSGMSPAKSASPEKIHDKPPVASSETYSASHIDASTGAKHIPSVKFTDIATADDSAPGPASQIHSAVLPGTKIGKGARNPGTKYSTSGVSPAKTVAPKETREKPVNISLATDSSFDVEASAVAKHVSSVKACGATAVESTTNPDCPSLSAALRGVKKVKNAKGSDAQDLTSAVFTAVTAASEKTQEKQAEVSVRAGSVCIDCESKLEKFISSVKAADVAAANDSASSVSSPLLPTQPSGTKKGKHAKSSGAKQPTSATPATKIVALEKAQDSLSYVSLQTCSTSNAGGSKVGKHNPSVKATGVSEPDVSAATTARTIMSAVFSSTKIGRCAKDSDAKHITLGITTGDSATPEKTLDEPPDIPSATSIASYACGSTVGMTRSSFVVKTEKRYASEKTKDQPKPVPLRTGPASNVTKTIVIKEYPSAKSMRATASAHSSVSSRISCMKSKKDANVPAAKRSASAVKTEKNTSPEKSLNQPRNVPTGTGSALNVDQCAVAKDCFSVIESDFDTSATAGSDIEAVSADESDPRGELDLPFYLEWSSNVKRWEAGISPPCLEQACLPPSIPEAELVAGAADVVAADPSDLRVEIRNGVYCIKLYDTRYELIGFPAGDIPSPDFSTIRVPTPSARRLSM